MAFTQATFAPAGNQSKRAALDTDAGSPAASLNGAPQVWTYQTADTAATVNTSGYFNAVASLLRAGDFIFAACGANSGGTLAPRIFVVLSNTGSVVDVSDGTAVTISDTD